MAQLNKFDKVNQMRTQAIPYEKFFGDMDLEDKDKELRIGLANKLDDMFYYFLAMLDEDNVDEIKNSLKQQFKDTVAEYFKDTINPGDYMDEYINVVVDSVVNTTVKNKGDSWYVSEDRAQYLSEDETNGIANYYQERQALLEGKTTKVWRTILDGKERHTHFIANAQEVPIGEAFVVGNSRLMYPKDISLGADVTELIGCRCTCWYI